jgi:hypothetical protein
MAEWTAAGGNNTSGQFDIFIGIQNGAVNPADADAIRFTIASSNYWSRSAARSRIHASSHYSG